MSALNVCNGTRPSLYCSVLAISAPPKRPEQIILTPSAPKRIADDMPLPEYGNLFQRQVEDETIPQYTDYKHVDNFIKARINWRRRRLQELIKDAEMELEDLRKRIR